MQRSKIRSTPPPDVPGVQRFGIYYEDTTERFGTFLSNFVNTGRKAERTFYRYLLSKNCTEKDRRNLTGIRSNGNLYDVLGADKFKAIYEYKFQTPAEKQLEIDAVYFAFHGFTYKFLIEFLDSKFQKWCREAHPEQILPPRPVEDMNYYEYPIVQLPYIEDFDGVQLTSDGLGVLTDQGITTTPGDGMDSDSDSDGVFFDEEGRVGVNTVPPVVYVPVIAEANAEVQAMDCDPVHTEFAPRVEVQTLAELSATTVGEHFLQYRRQFENDILNRGRTLRSGRYFGSTSKSLETDDAAQSPSEIDDLSKYNIARELKLFLRESEKRRRIREEWKFRKKKRKISSSIRAEVVESDDD